MKYNAFEIEYNGRVVQLCTFANLINPFSEKHFKTQKALWDTGATKSVINVQLAKDLELTPTDRVMTSGVHGKQEVDCFDITTVLEFCVPHIDGIETLLERANKRNKRSNNKRYKKSR